MLRSLVHKELLSIAPQPNKKSGGVDCRRRSHATSLLSVTATETFSRIMLALCFNIIVGSIGVVSTALILTAILSKCIAKRIIGKPLQNTFSNPKDSPIWHLRLALDCLTNLCIFSFFIHSMCISLIRFGIFPTSNTWCTRIARFRSMYPASLTNHRFNSLIQNDSQCVPHVTMCTLRNLCDSYLHWFQQLNILLFNKICHHTNNNCYLTLIHDCNAARHPARSCPWRIQRGIPILSASLHPSSCDCIWIN